MTTVERPEGQVTRLIVLRVGPNDYALGIGEVVEVLRMASLTPLPEAPGWMAGLLNLRGRGVPILDLRSRLGGVSRPHHPDMRIVIARPARVDAEAPGRDFGLIVDDVPEVLDVPAAAFEPPSAEVALAAPSVRAVTHAGGRTVLWLDLDRLDPG